MTRRTLRLEPCKRSRGDLQLVLYWKRAPQPSLLVIRAAGIEREVLVYPRHAHLILFLLDAWHRDKGQPERMRGIRTREEISRGLALFRGSVQLNTVVNYVYQFRVALKKASSEESSGAGGDLESIDLFERGPGPGYRIGPVDLVVVPVAPEISE